MEYKVPGDFNMNKNRYTNIYYLVTMLIIMGGGLIAPTDSKATAQSAIYGYDPVAYFTMKQAKKGLPQYDHQWDGKTWFFVSTQHREMFIANPQKYLPQFNGLCANGLSDGHAIDADPENWRIIDGKLYLFFSRYGRDQWSGNVKELIESAKETLEDH